MNVPINPYLFYAMAAVVIFGAIGVVRAANIFHAGLSLALTFGAVAAIYGILDAHFLAVVQVLIYVGAIAVILSFAVMLTGHIGQREPGPPFMRQLSAFAGVAAFAALVLPAVYRQTWPLQNWDPNPVSSPQSGSYIDVTTIAKLFLGREHGHYLLPFEIVAVLLLMALVAAMMVASSKEER